MWQQQFIPDETRRLYKCTKINCCPEAAKNIFQINPHFINVRKLILAHETATIHLR
jgi:hypothetical protein